MRDSQLRNKALIARLRLELTRRLRRPHCVLNMSSTIDIHLVLYANPS